MSHIHTEKGQYDFTASAFIIRVDGTEPKLLLHMHKKIGKLLQAGGHVELDENPWQAICHEIIEETGYELSQLKLLQPPYIPIISLPDGVLLPTPVCVSTHGFEIWPDHFHIDTAYAFITESLPTNLPAEGESSELVWLTFGELSDLDSSLIVENIREIGKSVLTTVFVNWGAVDLPKG